MEQLFFSVEETAELLNLHPKTVRRFIREEQIKAVKIGRAWRISRENLKEYTHGELAAPRNDEKAPTGIEARINVSAVIEIEESPAGEASRISNSLIALLNCKDPSWGESRYDFIYHPETKRARFILYGTPLFLSVVFKSMEVITKQEER